MSNGKAEGSSQRRRRLAVYHILCTSQSKPTILHVPARSRKEAIQIASSAVEDIIIMFATQITSKSNI